MHVHPDVSIELRNPSPLLLAEQLPHSLHDTVLLWVVRVVLRRDLEQAGESLVVGVDAGSYALGNLLQVLATCMLGRQPPQKHCSYSIRVG
jgi:hypothetical protein